MQNRFESAREISKVYHAITDRESLQGYFFQSLAGLLSSQSFALYFSGRENKLWLEISEGFSDADLPRLQSVSDGVQISGRPFMHKNLLAVPLVAGNNCFGVACIEAAHTQKFSDEDRDIAVSLGMEFANAVKSIKLMEENIRMERLAAIGQTSSMVVHELKNILQLARLSEEMLQMGLRDNNPKFIEMGNKKIKHALKEMDGFIWEMLSLGRDQKLETQVVVLKELFAELEDDLQTKTKASSAIFKYEVPENFPEVNIDRRAIFRALLNLTKNAYEARKGDAISVTIKTESLNTEYYLVTVSDTGVGMSEETRARLFQAFYTTKGEGGTGLGLMVVGNTIRLHRGTIEVESEVGKGTRFLIKLPYQPTLAVVN